MGTKSWNFWRLPFPRRGKRGAGSSRRRRRFPGFTQKDLDDLGPVDTSPSEPSELALVLTGGGAKGAYQVGVIRCLARHFPDARIPIITGVSAGAVNGVHLAAHHGSLAQAAEELVGLWTELTPERVFRTDWGSLGLGVARNIARLLSGGILPAPEVRGLVDTTPLRRYLDESMAAIEGEITGIDYNLHRGTLKALAVSTTNYSTGQNIVFVQGREFDVWERPYRKSVQTRIRVAHVMASTALPGFFPAVQLGDHWYGDGGIRLTAPLSPALHLGAERILAISANHHGSRAQADAPEISGYPPPAQILGVMASSVFLDTLDTDERQLRRMNEVIRSVPERYRKSLRPVDIMVLRPSVDLSKVAQEYEPRLPRGFRFLTRGLGTRETGSPDVLAMMMFQPDYIRRLIELGDEDTGRRLSELASLLDVDQPDPARISDRAG